MTQTAIKPMTIVGRESEANTISYYIQSGAENVYLAKIENGKATSCQSFYTGEECNAYHFSPRNHKGCKHCTFAQANESTRATDQHIHVVEEIHTCVTCSNRVKKANSYCFGCLA